MEFLRGQLYQLSLYTFYPLACENECMYVKTIFNFVSPGMGVDYSSVDKQETLVF